MVKTQPVLGDEKKRCYYCHESIPNSEMKKHYCSRHDICEDNLKELEEERQNRVNSGNVRE